jgi:hypothetical protein
MKPAWVYRLAQNRLNRNKWMIEEYRPDLERWVRSKTKIMLTSKNVVGQTVPQRSYGTITVRDRLSPFKFEDAMTQLVALREKFPSKVFRARRYMQQDIIMAAIL